MKVLRNRVRNPITRPHTHEILAVGAITRRDRTFENSRERQRSSKSPRTNQIAPRSPSNPVLQSRTHRHASTAASSDIWPLTARLTRIKSFAATHAEMPDILHETARIAERRHNRSRRHSRNRRRMHNRSTRVRNLRMPSPLRDPAPRNSSHTRRSIQSASPMHSWTPARPSR